MRTLVRLLAVAVMVAALPARADNWAEGDDAEEAPPPPPPRRGRSTGAAPMKRSFFIVRGEIERLPGGPFGGLGIDFGSLQSEYIATATRIQVERGLGGDLTAVVIAGGPHFRIPLGDELMLMPALNLGIRLSDDGPEYAGYFSMGLGYKLPNFFVMAEWQTPLFLRRFVPGPQYFYAGIGFPF